MAALTDVVSLDRAKRWFSVGSGDTAQDQQLVAAITAASEWLDDKCGPIVQRVVDGVVVGRFATTAAAANTRFEMAAFMFTAWLLRAAVLRVAPVDGYDAPAFDFADAPIDAIRALLGDEWVDLEITDEPASAFGTYALGIWAPAP